MARPWLIFSQEMKAANQNVGRTSARQRGLRKRPLKGLAQKVNAPVATLRQPEGKRLLEEQNKKTSHPQKPLGLPGSTDTRNPDRDYAFWDKHPGIAWSNPHADNNTMIVITIYQFRTKALDDVIRHFGTQTVQNIWHYMKSHAELPEDTERMKRLTPQFEDWLEKAEHAI